MKKKNTYRNTQSKFLRHILSSAILISAATPAIASNEVVACIDTDGDGWGWNGSTSCQVITETHCNYDNAHLSGGWGWDSVASQSCPPIAGDVSGPCVDTDNDGWGWNGIESCRVNTEDTSTQYTWQDTGEPISGTKTLHWRDTDIAGKTLQCINGYAASNYAEVSQFQFRADGSGVYNYTSGGRAYENNSARTETFNWLISDTGVITSPTALSGRALSLLDKPVVERDRGYWFLLPENDNSVSNYNDCSLLDGSVLRATGGTDDPQNCIDSDGDGWGWDGTDSCIP